MKHENTAVIEFGAWCSARGIEFKDTKAGRGEARQAFKVWYLQRAEHSQQIGCARRNLEWMKKQLEERLTGRA